MSKIDWGVIHDTWRALGKPLDGETLLRVKVTAGIETAHAVAVAQEAVPMVIRWMATVYPKGNYPPVNVPKALIACLERYGKAAFKRHEELEQWGVSWADYLTAQSDIQFRRSDQTPNLWTVFNDVGVQRYNRSLNNAQKVDGRTVRVLTPGMVSALTGKDRWEVLVEKWEAGRNVVTNALLSCPGLSPEAVILLESHMLDAAFLIADRDGINAIDSGILPRPKVEVAMNLLVELERDKYTSRRFYGAVIEKGAVL